MKLKLLLIIAILFLAFSGKAQWSIIGNYPAISGVFNDVITATTTDSKGNLYAIGNFTNELGDYHVAKWNGTQWQELGGANNNTFVGSPKINCITTDTSGNVYVAGEITNKHYYNYVAVWNGSSWSELGGVNSSNLNGTINSICCDSNGTIYVAGNINNNSSDYYVAKYGGFWLGWQKLGPASTAMFNNPITKLTIDNSGNIYAIGNFTNYYKKYYVAIFNGSDWNQVGGYNKSTLSQSINCISTDKNGNVYIGGNFTNSNGKYYVSKWAGNAWQELGGANNSTFNKSINSIVTDTIGNIYTAGNFTNSNGKYYVAMWNGSSWNELGGTNSSTFNGSINSISTDIVGNVYAAGRLTDTSGNKSIAKWNGSSWKNISVAVNYALNNNIYSIVTDISGDLYAVGDFVNGNGKYFVAKWNGNSWHELGGENNSTFNGTIRSIVTDKTGNIYIAGKFKNDSSKYYIAKWDGSSWNELGGKNSSKFNDYINCLYVDNMYIYAAGGFRNSKNNTYVAKWNGSIWQELGGSNNSIMSTYINAITIDKNGNVYAAGDSRNSYSQYFVAKWNGSTWKDIDGFSNSIKTLCTDTAGNVYAAGTFRNGIYANSPNYVAKWNGSNWTMLGSTIFTTANYSEIYTICLDLSGNLYAAGSFWNNNNKCYVAKWDGSSWSEFGGTDSSSFNGYINCLFKGTSGEVYAAGNFNVSYVGYLTTYVAKYSLPKNIINGNIKTYNGINIKNVKIGYTGTLVGSVVNYSTGSFNIEIAYGNYTLTPTKNNDINKTNGITALDLAITQAHVLGKALLNSPYKIIAADVNDDGKVTALDLVYMKRLILGIDTTFTNTSTKETRLWAFVDSSYQFADSANPFPFKDSISYTNLNANQTNQTFIGIKLGDVNWDWNPALARSLPALPRRVLIQTTPPSKGGN